MLKFIFGLPCSGKSYTCFEKIKELSDSQKQTVLIVPEQFSFESERESLNVLGDGFALKTAVLSFSRLYDEISRNVGGICARTLTDADKIIFMNRALIQIADQLKLWGKYAHSVSFAKTMLDTVSEFKINAITNKELEKAAKIADKASLKDKLYDLKLIYENYDSLLGERFIDPSDKLSKLYDNLSNFKYFEGKTVFIDSFKGFTGGQFKILERIISQAEDVYISFTNDTSNLREYDIFTNIRTAVLKITNIAEKYNVKIEAPIILDKQFYNSDNLKSVERLISGNGNDVYSDNSNNITVCCANTPYDEAEFVARNIRKLVRNENYRFRDFVIIARDVERYSQAIEYACLKNDVSMFFDKRVSLSSLPFSAMCENAIKALNFSSDNIFAFLKSGIKILTTDEISQLENYTYLWNVNGEIWLKNWDMTPKGFVTENLNEEDLKELEIINALRQKAITPILKFKQEFYGNAYNMSKAIVNLFNNCDLKTVLNDMCGQLKKNEDIFTADALKQGYSAYLKILDSLVVCFGERSISKSEFYEALTLAVSLETIGIIPQNLDQVTFGEADRIRPSRPKIAFILGANQDVFPKQSSNNGVFALSERKKLIEIGLEISDNSIFTSIDENFLVYCNLCCATDKVYVSYSKSNLKGDSLEPSAFVISICESLNPIITYEPLNKITVENLPETEKSAYSEFCKRINNTNDVAVFNKVFENSQEKQKIENLISVFNQDKKFITKENAQSLYGKNINMSATRLDTFNRCKFSYFCKYGLKTRKLQPADFDVLQRGTIVHYVLERFITDNADNFITIDETALDALTDQYINEYLSLISGYSTIKNARHEFIISKISRSLKEVVRHLAKELSQSEFKPVACELKIGKEGIGLNFDYTDGKIIFNGSIDRVDSYSGYVRVVDYKTGSKKFKLPDTLFGLNLQMLMYLYALTKSPKCEPAGILYMPSKRDLSDEGMAMNGLILQDREIVTAMERENKGEFIPKLPINKDGSISKTATSFVEKQDFETIFSYIEKLMFKVGNSISDGDISIDPIDGNESAACAYCDFKAVCGIENKEIFKVPNLKNNEVFEKMKEAE